MDGGEEASHGRDREREREREREKESERERERETFSIQHIVAFRSVIHEVPPDYRNLLPSPTVVTLR